jgi:uroporphyrinogen-III synthase
MREASIENNDELLLFSERLFAGGFDMMVLLTGVGTRALRHAIGDSLASALRALTTVARGPKPAAVLREMGLAPSIAVPPPNTWREVLAATEGRPERRIAVQEYGRPNPELVDGFRARGAEVTAVRVYRWDLPEDLEPLRRAARELAAGRFGAVLFTTAVQVPHLFRIASELGVERQASEALARAFVASIGPATTEMLEEFGVRPALEASQGKMGILVREAAESAPQLQ